MMWTDGRSGSESGQNVGGPFFFSFSALLDACSRGFCCVVCGLRCGACRRGDKDFFLETFLFFFCCSLVLTLFILFYPFCLLVCRTLLLPYLTSRITLLCLALRCMFIGFSYTTSATP